MMASFLVQLISSVYLSETILTGVEGSRPVQFPGAILGPEGDLTPVIRTGYTCEGEELMIQCEEDSDIQIIRANYGRFSIAICNDDGKTHWSVNCMSPKTRHILQKRCDSRNSCTVPVSSDLFGDPCPGTHKYVEIHYTCSPKTDATRRPLPPWYLQQPSLHSNSDFWLQNSASARHSDLSVGGDSSGSDIKTSYNSRIPILVATTTEPPRRIPITITTPTTTTTTSEPVTTSSTTSETVPTTPDVSEETSKEADVLLQRTNEVVINHELDPATEPKSLLNHNSDTLYTTIINTEDNMEEDMMVSEEELVNYCQPTTARNLFWKMTRGGQMMIQPCPNGATGLARWQCLSSRSEAGSALWSSTQPDMSDCKSVPMTNLEVKVRQEDPENVIASSLARLTGSRQLYGGDLLSAVEVMKTVASRIQYLLQQRSDKFYKKEAFIQEVLLNIVRSASNLLDVKNRDAWNDLEVATQMKVASSLLLAVEENAFLFAEVTNKPEILMESSYNILMAISVLNVKDIRNGSSFPLNNYEEPFGTIEDSIFLPVRALESNAREKLVKAVFFSFKHLDEILSRSDKSSTTSSYHGGHTAASSHQILNSRVISASLVRGKHLQLPQSAPVRVSLKHLREEGMGNPVCVFWDLDTSTWSRAGCEVVDTNLSRTTCQCNHLTNFALLMEEQSVPIVIHLPAFHVEIIVGAVISVFLLVIFLVVFKFREQVQKMMKIPCSKEEKKKGLENCHKSQSFFNGINLMQVPGPGGDKTQTLSTNMADSQSRLSQYILSSGTGAAVGLGEDGADRYENVHGDRYEDISSTDQATLPMRARMSPHITLNPYSTQLVDNLNRMMTASGGSPQHHIYQVAMTPQLSNLTNTLKKKKCVGGHRGECLHSRTMTPLQSDSSVRSDSLTPLGDNDTDTEILPHSTAQDVVFRAVSPHGHVYWEIDPKRPNKLASTIHGAAGHLGHSDEDTHNDLHNMSDFSEDDASKLTAASDRSRQSSSRFSDNRPLLSSSSPCHVMSPLPESMVSTTPIIMPPYSPNQRFMTLSSQAHPQVQTQFSTRTRLGRTQPRQRPEAADQQQFQVPDLRLTEQLQQQIQIPDLRRIPVSVKSSEYIMAKIQNHMDQSQKRNGKNNRQEREV